MGLKDAIKRRTHKERSQPSARSHYGLLEKKKDYLLRAKDFHKKEATIKNLKRKAEERNPDEFYFSMEKARTKDGVHIARSTEANKYTREQLMLMKTQDAGYLNLKAQAESKKVDKMKQSLHLIGAPTQRRHVVFVDDENEAETFDPAAHFDTPAELLDRSYNRPRKAQLAEAAVVSSGAAVAEKLLTKAEKQKQAAYKELLQRQQRKTVLGNLAQKMEYDRQVMGKGRKRKLMSEEKTDGSEKQQRVFKWKAERKK